MATQLPLILASERETEVFAKEETTFAAGVKPAAGDYIPLIGTLDPVQNLGYILDRQRRRTFSEVNEFPGRYEPGALTLPMYMKPSGSAGTAPIGDVLYKAWAGRKTINAGVDVQYSPLRMGVDARPTVTIWVIKGHFVYMCWGCLLTRASIPLRGNNDESAMSQISFDVSFAELRWTGTDELAATLSTGASTFTAKDAKKYTIGSYVKFKTVAGVVDDNSAAGYQVTEVNYSTKVVTFSPVLAGAGLATDDLVLPWTPTGTDAGNAVHGRLGTATRGGVSLPLLSGEIRWGLGVKLLNEEKNGKDFADRFVSVGTRTLEVDADIYMDANAPRFFYDAKNNVKADMAYVWGTTAGSIITATCKNVRFAAPTTSGEEEKVEQLRGKGFASSSFDDECVLKFS